MSLVINDGSGTPVSHTFTQEQAQQGPTAPAVLLDRSAALGPQSFLRFDALAKFGRGSAPVDMTQLHLFCPHWTDPGTGVLQRTGTVDVWFNVNSTGTASADAVRQKYAMLMVNALANATVKGSIFSISPLVV
jgi:hypothetical protein